MAAEANIFRFTQGMFGTALNGAVAQEVQAGLAATTVWLHALGAMWLFATVYLALSQNLSLGRFFTRIMRVLVVTALILHPDTYNRFVVQPVMNGLPNLIAQTFGGGQGVQTIPDQFAAVFTMIEHLSAQLRAQASPPAFYIAERFNISMAEFSCKMLLVPEYAIWVCVHAFQALLVVAGTIALVFYLFDKTQGYAEAWAGKIAGSLLAVMLMSVVLQIIFVMNSSYMNSVQTLPISTGGNAVNVSEGIDILFNIACVFFLGIFMMVVAVLIGFGIGRASGFDAGSIVRAITRGANTGKLS